MNHYQIKTRNGDLLYDSRLDSSFKGFATDGGARMAANAKLEYAKLPKEDYKIEILSIDYLSSEEFDYQLND